jgi:hypothetical protein
MFLLAVHPSFFNLPGEAWRDNWTEHFHTSAIACTQESWLQFLVNTDSWGLKTHWWMKLKCHLLTNLLKEWPCFLWKRQLFTYKLKCNSCNSNVIVTSPKFSHWPRPHTRLHYPPLHFHPPCPIKIHRKSAILHPNPLDVKQSSICRSVLLDGIIHAPGPNTKCAGITFPTVFWIGLQGCCFAVIQWILVGWLLTDASL